MNRNANKARGEESIRIGTEDYLLRPTFQSLVAAEEELGSLFSLVERASNGDLTVAEITALLWHCLPNEERPQRTVVGEAVLALGLVAAAKPVRVILGQVLQGQV